MSISKELLDIANQLDKYIDYEIPELNALAEAAKSVGRSWSKSTLGYHSRVYYQNFQVPPPGSVFDAEWGLDDFFGVQSQSIGNWIEYNSEDVDRIIREKTENPDDNRILSDRHAAITIFERVKSTVISLVYANYPESDRYMQSLLEKIESSKVKLNKSSIQTHLPQGKTITSDKRAVSEGYQTPPHISVLVYVLSAKQSFQSCKDLKKQIVELANHIQNMEKSGTKAHTNALISSDIFIVHGRDDGTKETVARFVEKLGLKATILHEQPNESRTIIEKLEDCADRAGFAIVLLTPDDVGALKDRIEDESKPRARQNVIFELGYFMGKLGRKRVCPLFKGEIENPSDIDGVVYVSMNNTDGWKLKLCQEMKNAGFPIDLNKLA